jgi:hypothetical protein
MTTAAEAQAELDRRAAAANGKPLQMGPTRAEAAAELQRRQASQPTEQGFMSRAGDVAGDLAKSALSGVARGVRNTVQLPAMIGGTIDRGFEKIGLAPEGFAADMRDQGILSSQNIGDFASTITGGGTDFQPETRAGRFAQTGADFATSGGLLGGAKGLVRGGLIPGVASETAGQLTEGTAAEPIARTVAALGAGIAATPRSANFTRGADADELASANRLGDAGVRASAGQVRNSDTLMRLEGTSGPTGQQLDDFTAAAMRTTGSTASNARPSALAQASDQITDGMNAILKDVDVPFSTGIGQRVGDIAADYAEGTAGKMPSVNLRRISDQIIDAATSPSSRTIPASTLRQWRTRLGKMTTSNDEAVRDMAHELRTVIDDVTESQLASLGRLDDVSKLAVLRNQYRNFLTIADASTKGGREGARGVLSPERVSTASTRTVGRTNAALGRGTDLTELALDAKGMIGSASTVAPGAFRNVQFAGGSGLGGAGIGGFLGGPYGAAIGGAAGLAGPAAVQGLLRSPVVQNALNNPQSLAQLGPILPGLLSQDRR